MHFVRMSALNLLATHSLIDLTANNLVHVFKFDRWQMIGFVKTSCCLDP
jgi:hypothetical protein